MSGSTGERVAVVTASARSLPALTYSIDDDMVANITCTCPPRVASNARDRRDVADEIEIELVVEGGVDRVHSNASEKRIAVGGRTYNGLGATLLAAPGRFSMTNCWPSRSDSHCPIRRAMMSVPPAGQIRR